MDARASDLLKVFAESLGSGPADPLGDPRFHDFTIHAYRNDDDGTLGDVAEILLREFGLARETAHAWAVVYRHGAALLRRYDETRDENVLP